MKNFILILGFLFSLKVYSQKEYNELFLTVNVTVSEFFDVYLQTQENYRKEFFDYIENRVKELGVKKRPSGIYYRGTKAYFLNSLICIENRIFKNNFSSAESRRSIIDECTNLKFGTKPYQRITDWGPGWGIAGKVWDKSNNRSIEFAKVTVKGSEVYRFSQPDGGNFSFPRNSIPKQFFKGTLLVEKEGYYPSEYPINSTIHEITSGHNVALKPIYKKLQFSFEEGNECLEHLIRNQNLELIFFHGKDKKTFKLSSFYPNSLTVHHVRLPDLIKNPLIKFVPNIKGVPVIRFNYQEDKTHYTLSYSGFTCIKGNKKVVTRDMNEKPKLRADWVFSSGQYTALSNDKGDFTVVVPMEGTKLVEVKEKELSSYTLLQPIHPVQVEAIENEVSDVGQFTNMLNCEHPRKSNIFVGTGYNYEDKKSLPPGAIDPYWQIKNEQKTLKAFVIEPYISWKTFAEIPDFIGASNFKIKPQWISSHNSAKVRVRKGSYIMEKCFCLNEVSSDTRLELISIADDEMKLHLNDIFTGVTQNWPANGKVIGENIKNRAQWKKFFEENKKVVGSKYFKPGINCLQAEVQDTGSIAMGLSMFGYLLDSKDNIEDMRCCHERVRLME